MLVDHRKARGWIFVAACAFMCTNSNAQSTLLDEVHTVADAAHAVPVEHTFNVSVAGTYQITLTDLGAALTPSAPLASVKLAITNGSTIVGTPLTAAGSTQFNAAVGAYVIRVVGAPGQVAGSGPIGIQVTSVPGNTPLVSFSDTLALPTAALPSNEAVIDDSFTVAADGNYVVTLSDLKLPQPLTTLTLVITKSDGTFVTNPPLAGGSSTTVPLHQGVTYRVFAAGKADATVNAGLYSATVAPAGGGSRAYSKVVPVGTVSPAASAPLTGGTSYTLNLVDLAFPAALTTLGAVVTLNGQVVAQLAAAGTSSPFTAVASGTCQVFALASTSAMGSYSVTIAPPGGPAALAIARAVTVPGGSVSAYSFDTTVVNAGAYSLDVADFLIPAQLTSVSAAAVQGGAVLGTPLKTAGSASVTAAAGPISLLMFAKPAVAGGLFDIDLAPSGGGTPVFETTQGVGQLFIERQVSIATAGSYAASVSDVGFPAPLANFAVIVTRGSSQVGSIYGGGGFTFPAATPGNYFINFIAQPGGTDGAGTYALSVAPAPVVNLQSSVASVTSGATVTLTWTTQNATACTASGGWSGTPILNGSVQSAALTSSTTFTLTCTGEGVSVAKSVTVTISDPPPSGGGGGGEISIDLLAALAMTLALRLSQWCRKYWNGLGIQQCCADVVSPLA